MTNTSRDIKIVSSIFLMLVVAKCILISGTTGPIIIDEVIYKENALKIFREQFLDTTHYPPLYSVLQSAAFFSEKHWYGAMLFINAVVSSTVVIPAWMLAKEFLPGPLALIAVIITALWPFHATYSRVLMSENLYVPLFLFSIYVLMKMDSADRRSSLVFHALLGVLTALAYLTRHIHLVAIPALVILWLVRPLFREDATRRAVFERSRLLELLAFFAGFALAYSPWLVYAHHAGLSVCEAMGKKYVTVRLAAATLSSLMLWTSFYLSYIILACAPYLLFFSLYGFRALSRSTRYSRRETFFLTVVLLLSSVFLATAIQHSWIAIYNYPQPNRVMGRYLMHLSPLYLILFMIGLNKMRDEFDSLHVSTIVLAALLSCGAILFSWGVLFRSPMWHLKFDFVNSPDGVSYQFTIFTALMLLAVVVMAVILAFGRKNPTTARRFVLPFSVFVIVFVQIASCFGAYHWSVLRDREIVHGKVLAEFLQDEVKKKAHKITLVCDTPSASASAALVLSYSLKFWLSLPEKDRSVDVIREDIAADNGGMQYAHVKLRYRKERNPVLRDNQRMGARPLPSVGKYGSRSSV